MFGNDNDVLVIKLNSSELNKLHDQIKEHGVEFTRKEYHPHMTLQDPVKETFSKEKIQVLVNELPDIVLEDFNVEDVVRKWKSS